MNYFSKLRRITSRELALFCPACPQPRINVPVEPGNDFTHWKYTQTIVMDGNFKAEHMHCSLPEDDVYLMDGLAFMVTGPRYKEFLALTEYPAERSDCNNHRAVNRVNADRHRLEVMGISGCACARHGCFYPHAMVDFQKGESIRRVITFYDVNCQYSKHLAR
ncbi:hypothetical protein BU15DRAFT_90248 [Melanogaster broomeanus]|nr:hypothetical protein BU15DRAFT_90248 [Melanogaster broomeanus]